MSLSFKIFKLIKICKVCISKGLYFYIIEGAHIVPDNSNFVKKVICCNSPMGNLN